MVCDTVLKCLGYFCNRFELISSQSTLRFIVLCIVLFPKEVFEMGEL
jgi:hypothetical protein